MSQKLKLIIKTRHFYFDIFVHFCWPFKQFQVIVAVGVQWLMLAEEENGSSRRISHIGIERWRLRRLIWVLQRWLGGCGKRASCAVCVLPLEVSGRLGQLAIKENQLKWMQPTANRRGWSSTLWLKLCPRNYWWRFGKYFLKALLRDAKFDCPAMTGFSMYP